MSFSARGLKPYEDAPASTRRLAPRSPPSLPSHMPAIDDIKWTCILRAFSLSLTVPADGLKRLNPSS